MDTNQHVKYAIGYTIVGYGIRDKAGILADKETGRACIFNTQAQCRDYIDKNLRVQEVEIVFLQIREN